MELGASFDDDFFEKAPDKKAKVPLEYNAKICTPKWFMDPQCVADGNPDQLSNLRHQADFHYFSKKYEDASKIYHRCLEIVPESNTTVRRECMENLARSLLYMNEEEKSLEWALRLHSLAYTADQLLISWNLLAVVCHRLGKFAEEMEALECCLETHRFNPDLWLRLSYCHAGLLDINLPDSGVKRTHKFTKETSCCPYHQRNHSLNDENTGGDVAPESDELSATARQADNNIVFELSLDCGCDESTEDSATCRNRYKCEVCQIGTQIITACLLKSSILLECAHAHYPAFGKEKRDQLETKLHGCLRAIEMEQQFVEQAAVMLHSDIVEELKKNTESKEASAVDPGKCHKAEDSHVSDCPKAGSSSSQDSEQKLEASES